MGSSETRLSGSVIKDSSGRSPPGSLARRKTTRILFYAKNIDHVVFYMDAQYACLTKRSYIRAELQATLMPMVGSIS